MSITKTTDLIIPQVMADMISAKLPKLIKVSPFAKVDDSLSGVPGDEITVPQYEYIGDASDVAEGEAAVTSTLKASTTKVKIKKAMKAVALTDEAVLSGYGNPVSEANYQIAKSIAAKVDSDAMDALLGAALRYNGSAAQIKYAGIVDAIDCFNEETNTEKVMFIHPKQLTSLRKDSEFVSADKYPQNVMIKGEIGKIANTRIVVSKRVPLNEEIMEQYIPAVAEDDGALLVVATDAAEGEVLLSEVLEDIVNAKAGDYVKILSGISAGKCYCNPIVNIDEDIADEDALPALTVYVKRDTNVETERVTLKRLTNISADKLYTVALTNLSKVVLAYFKK